MAEKNLKPYNEKLVANLYTKEYETESKKNPWTFYPSNQVRVDFLSYSWETSYGLYEWEKIKITNQKRELENGAAVNKKKSNQYGRIVDDCSVVSMSLIELNDLLEWQSDIMEALKGAIN